VTLTSPTPMMLPAVACIMGLARFSPKRRSNADEMAALLAK
jgi:hypothetical protein